MKSIFRAIMRALRSMPIFVMQRIKQGGEWIMRLVSVPGEPAAPDIEEVMEKAQADEQLAAMRAIAAHILGGTIPSPELSGKITENQFGWLAICSDEMLRSICRADDRSLRDHVLNKKSIKGVLRNDPESIAEYVRVKAAPWEPDTEPEKTAFNFA